MVRSGPDCATIVGEKIFRKGVYSMTQETLNYVVEKTKELMAAPSCSQEAKDAAQAWLDAVGSGIRSRKDKRSRCSWKRIKSCRQTVL